MTNIIALLLGLDATELLYCKVVGLESDSVTPFDIYVA
jgi:hypothetical protein